MNNKELLPCPFCNSIPRIDNAGTFISIDCCVSMNIQKSDYLTLEERDTWSDENYMYRDDLEEKVLKILINNWNTRV